MDSSNKRGRSRFSRKLYVRGNAFSTHAITLWRLFSVLSRGDMANKASLSLDDAVGELAHGRTPAASWCLHS